MSSTVIQTTVRSKLAPEAHNVEPLPSELHARDRNGELASFEVCCRRFEIAADETYMEAVLHEFRAWGKRANRSCDAGYRWVVSHVAPFIGSLAAFSVVWVSLEEDGPFQGSAEPKGDWFRLCERCRAEGRLASPGFVGQRISRAARRVRLKRRETTLQALIEAVSA